MSVADLLVIGGYLLLIFGVGLSFSRRAHQDTDNYFLSGRSLPWWVAGTSMVATSFSCDTPLYVTNLVRTGGVSLNWQWWSFAIGSLFGAFFLARLWRRANVVTDVELTQLRYGGKPGRVLRVVRAAWISLLINTIGMSWVVLAMAKIIGEVWGGPKWVGVLIATVLAVTYSFSAGFWGVVVTDVAQFIIALLGAVILAVFAVQTAGGMDHIMETVPAAKISLIPHIPETGLFSMETLTGVFGGFIVYISIQWWANLNSDGGGKLIQRMSACKNETHAFGATLWFNVAHFALRTWPWVIVALASLVLWPELGGELTDHELAYPKMMMMLPSGMRGLLVAGLVAAFMSTIDTQLNWGASYLTHDVYRGWLAPGKSEKHYLIAAKVAMLTLIAITSIVAYFISSVTEAFKFIIAFGAGTGAVYVLRWFWWRISAWSEISAMTASSVISTVLYLAFPQTPFAIKVVIITFGSALVFVPVTFLTPPPPRDALVEFFKRTRPPGAWSAIRREAGIEMDARYTSLWPDIFGWIGGIMLTFGATFAIGFAVYQQPLNATIATLITLAGGAITLWWVKQKAPKK